MAEAKTKARKGDDIAEARKQFQICSDRENDNRLVAVDDIRFARLGEQWPSDIKKQRDLEGRPTLVFNRMTSFIRQVVNDSRQNKPSIKVQPVDSKADPETAEILSGIIRNIETVSNAEVAYDTAVEQAVTGGFGYWRIKLDYTHDDAFDLDICIDRVINQFAVYGDPNSTAADSSDWDVAFIIDKISRDEFKRRYPQAAAVGFDTEAWRSAGNDWLSEDTVTVAEWWRRTEVDREIVQLSDGRIFSVEDLETNEDLQMALQAGEIEVVKQRVIKSKRVTQTIISGVDVLEEEKEFPCRYIPIVPVYGDEIIVEGQRHFRGLINQAKDAQREYNYWRSTATELVALAPKVPWIGPPEAFSEDDRWATANQKSHAYLVYGGNVPPQRQMLDTGAASGSLQNAMVAADDMKAITGLYDASLGARSNETSGRAIMARQREGDTATFHFIDNLTRAIRHTGRILIDMIPRVYSGERIMRVLGEDGTPKNIPINQQYMAGPDGAPINPEEQNYQEGDEAREFQQTVIAMHDLAVGKYDVAVTSGPSFTTRREEAAYQMGELIRSFPQAAAVVGGPMARNLDWPEADTIAERLEKMSGFGDEPQIPPDVQKTLDEGQQLIQQMQEQMQKMQAENAQLKAENDLKQAQTQLDAMKIKVDAKKVETEAQKAATAQYVAETEREKLSMEFARMRANAAVFAQ